MSFCRTQRCRCRQVFGGQQRWDEPNDTHGMKAPSKHARLNVCFCNTSWFRNRRNRHCTALATVEVFRCPFLGKEGKLSFDNGHPNKRIRKLPHKSIHSGSRYLSGVIPDFRCLGGIIRAMIPRSRDFHYQPISRTGINEATPMILGWRSRDPTRPT